MKNVLFISLVAVFSVACNDAKNEKETKNSMTTSDNPFFVESTLPYNAPDFNVINNIHFKPALLQGIADQNKTINTIANNSETPTFDNTILALEKSGVLLDRVSNVFYGLTGANTNDTLQAVQEEMAPKFSELQDAKYLNDKLFHRIKNLYHTI
jgi:peptidyl-dipeptidase Dcp